ncbi:MAG: TetR/AcrR family transcriptional regulator [Bacteroidota bacterium]|nr:TetR/AcrR family transcriptional regulator [Bacteroidota bacterium]
MQNKEIQEQRIKGYFLEAAKEMLKGEGLKSINVRSIAERAGYSYTTLYHYFKDLNELIFLCVKDFQDECEQFVKEEVKKEPRGTEKIKAITKAYIQYFTQYPGIFELCFIEKISNIGSKQPTTELIATFPDRLCSEEWKYCIDKNIITKEKVDIFTKQLRFTVTGMLLLYLNRMQPADYKEFIDTVEIQINQILNI